MNEINKKRANKPKDSPQSDIKEETKAKANKAKAAPRTKIKEGINKSRAKKPKVAARSDIKEESNKAKAKKSKVSPRSDIKESKRLETERAEFSEELRCSLIVFAVSSKSKPPPRTSIPWFRLPRSHRLILRLAH
jgi:hypothetical protein